MSRITCGWCGKIVTATAADNAADHMSEGAKCMGSGQPRSSHNFLRRSYAEFKGSPNLPKSDRVRR